MGSIEFAKKIKKYAILSFLLPLIAINSCFLLYKFYGSVQSNIDRFPNLNWNKVEHTYSWKEYISAYQNLRTYSYTNCSKYGYKLTYTNIDNETYEQPFDRSKDTSLSELEIKQNKEIKNFVGNFSENNKKIKSVRINRENYLNPKCIKNHKFLFLFFEKFNWLETILIKGINDNPAGFGNIKNPYFYGDASISRTARHFPMIFIFKPFLIFSAFFLFLYWKNNLNLFNELKNKNISSNFSKKFFYFGIFSCLFLILHATFLGLDVESKLFHKFRRLVLILFILFEVCAQIFLTKNLFSYKENLSNYIKPLILKIKIIFVSVVLLLTFVAFSILAFGNPSTAFKHILEWNYFSFLLFYYFLSRLLWK